MEATKYCHKCKKEISQQNYTIHEAMCRGAVGGQLFRSRVIDNSQPFWTQQSAQDVPSRHCNPNAQDPNLRPFKKQKGQGNQPYLDPQTNQRTQFQDPKESYRQDRVITQPRNQPETTNQQYGLGSRNFSQIQSQNVNRSNNRQRVAQQQKFPCPDCGYSMSMAELDTHPSQCKVKKGSCEYCQSQFPLQLLREHYLYCNQRQRQQNMMGSRQRRSSQPRTIRRADSQRQPVAQQHYHFTDDNGRQMCAQVITDQNGRQHTNVQRTNSEQSNSLDDLMRTNPLMAVLGLVSGMGGGMSVNVYSGNNTGGQQENPFQQLVRALIQRTAPENKRPLDRDIMKELPVIVYDNKNPDYAQSTSCTVCVTDFENGDHLIKLPCGHLFNKECIVPWLKNSSLCPNCRQTIKPGTRPSHSNQATGNMIQNPQNSRNQQRPGVQNPQPQRPQLNRANSNMNPNVRNPPPNQELGFLGTIARMFGGRS